jgi:cbb3-type cytochrome oxidase maturation protein
LSALILLIAVSILVAGGFLAAFLWSVKHGQYDDDYTASVRMLFDGNDKKKTSATSSKTKTQTK